jgi:hypothetical protein
MKEASRNATFLKTSPEFWMNLLMTCNLRNAERVCRRNVESKLVNTQARPLVLRVRFFSALARPLGKITLTAAIENG